MAEDQTKAGTRLENEGGQRLHAGAKAKRMASLAVFVVVAGAIFFLTAMPTSESGQMSGVVADAVEASTGIRNRPENFVSSPLPFQLLMQITSVRKWAHAVEFAAFGAAAFWLLRSWLSRLSLRRTAMLALTISVAYSVLDQVHKLFVPGREFDATDLIFDAVGYILAIVMVVLITRLVHHRFRDNSLGLADRKLNE